MGTDSLGGVMQTKEEIAARDKAYYQANKEAIAAQQKAYREDNKEQRAAYDKAYREANKEELKAHKKAYREDNKEEIAAYDKAYYEDNKEQRAAKQRAKRYERNLMLFNYKGAGCSHCGLSEPDHLEIYDYHHVDPTTKLYGVAYILNGSLERLMTEVDKCLLLCAHCHRKEHTRLNKEEL